ncbi:MAG: UUP1 family membrane protein, partial [SAR324 cluster bacterium]|nr:UUP1 family membrane protein [SAR324 cluster bacterium]
MKRSIKPLVSLLFIIAGLSIVYKILILDLPLLPESHDPSYRVEARVSFRGQDSNAVISLQIPKYHPGFQITNENFVSEGFSIASRIRDESRIVQWSRKHAKRSYDLLYEVTFRRLSQSRRANTDRPGEYVSTEHPPEIQQASEQLWEEARSRSS